MSRGGEGRGPDDRGQVEQAAGSRAKMECYKRRIYTYRKFRGGSREARWCTKVWARWHQVSVTPTRNLGYFFPQDSSSKSVFYRPALDALESPRGESCGPEARGYQREAQSTVTRDLPLGSKGRERLESWLESWSSRSGEKVSTLAPRDDICGKNLELVAYTQLDSP